MCRLHKGMVAGEASPLPGRQGRMRAQRLCLPGPACRGGSVGGHSANGIFKAVCRRGQRTVSGDTLENHKTMFTPPSVRQVPFLVPSFQPYRMFKRKQKTQEMARCPGLICFLQQEAGPTWRLRSQLHVKLRCSLGGSREAPTSGIARELNCSAL